jgi:hypothetical protein
MAALQAVEPVVPRVHPSAVAWIDSDRAIVARMSWDGRISICEVERRGEAELPYLALAARAVGDRERVQILGPSPMRLALEREYVAMFRRPDRLVDVEPAGPTEMEDLVERLRGLAA